MKDSFIDPIKINTQLFYSSLGALFVSALFIIIDRIDIWPPSIQFVDVLDPTTFIRTLLHKLPLLIPVLWLALFSSKRRSEAQRLQQEYAHKETIAKSYEGLRQQIEKLSSENEELLKKLLDTAITAIGYNASETLERKHGDKMPVQEFCEGVSSKFNELLTHSLLIASLPDRFFSTFLGKSLANFCLRFDNSIRLFLFGLFRAAIK